MYINKAFVFGNLTRDPELKALPSGNNVASFSLATNRTWKDQNGQKQENTDYHNIVAFGKQAEVIAQYLKKGRSVFIEGRMQTRSWEQEGQKRYRTEIVLESFQFGPSGGGAPSSGNNETAPAANKSAGKEDAIEYPEEDINPDDIPF